MDSAPKTTVPVESGYASRIELQRFTVNTICAKLYNDLIEMSRTRYCLTVTCNGRVVEVKEYTRLEPTTLYMLENKKLDVIT